MPIRAVTAVTGCAMVLAKLDPAHDPHYPDNAFLRPECRTALASRVRTIIHTMTAPAATKGWCELIKDVKALEGAFFDLQRNPNPGLQDFRRDWDRVRAAAGCP